jgi:adenylyl cyclase-associated protein
MQSVVDYLQTLETRLSAVEGKMGLTNSCIGDAPPAAAPAVAAANPAVGVPQSVVAFDAYCASCLDPFVAAAVKLGGDAEKGGKIVQEAWNELRSLILLASACKEPPDADKQKLMEGLHSKLKAIGGLLQRNEWERHVKTLSEGSGCLNWVLVKPGPCDFIESFIGGADYWANNLRKEFKVKDANQIAFCDTFKKLLNDLMPYVKQHHVAGLVWNPRGGAAKDFAASAPAPNAAPPPKPPGASGAVNLFAELNKGGAITSGLKTVTKDMQTWRKEYKGDAPAGAPVKKAAGGFSRASDAPKGPPKLEYQSHGAKWLVENQTADAGTVLVEISDIKQNVYIYGCIGATIDVKGKCKSIVLDSCKKTNINFDEVFSTIETVNSSRIKILCREKCAAAAIDKTDGIVLTLPASSLETPITASKSSEMNVQFPGPDGDLVEKPIPEQYVHRILDGKVTADVSDLYTH